MAGEQQIKELLEEIEKLKLELRRERAVTEIQNLMAHYEIVHNQKNMDKHLVDFALTMPDVEFRGEVGAENITRQFTTDWYMSEEEARGKLLIHYLTNPCIQVAGDCKTARGVWWSPGLECNPDEEAPEGLAAFWAFMMYAVDFIVEDGKWKIWHLRILPVIKCRYEEGPVKGYHWYFANKVKPDDPWYRNPYSTTYTQRSIPAYPQPYETWDGDTMWFTREENN